jgi:hypothetical protein
MSPSATALTATSVVLRVAPAQTGLMILGASPRRRTRMTICQVHSRVSAYSI